MLLLSAKISKAANGVNAPEIKKILVVSADHSSKSRVNLLNQLNRNKGLHFEHTKFSKKEKDALKTKIGGYDLVIFSAVSTKFAKQKFAELLPVPQNFPVPIATLPWSEDNSLRNRVSNLQGRTIGQYYRNGGIENMQRLGDYLKAEFFFDSFATVLPPIIYPSQGIYFPNSTAKIMPNLQQYLFEKGLTSPPADRPVIGVLMRLEHYGAGKSIVVDSLIKRLEQQGAFVIPFYIDEYNADFKPLILYQGKVAVHTIINLRTMHAPAKRGKQFEKLGVPVLHAIQYYGGTAQQWRDDNQGVSPMMTPFLLSMPESAGVIDITTIAASPRQSEEIEVLDEQITAITQRALGQANLALKPNAEKKIAMMVWNYPSGEKNISASFLNVPRSIGNITQALAKNGYKVTVSEEKTLLANVQRILRPFYRETEWQSLLDDDLAELMTVDSYNKQLNTLPLSVREKIEKDWGDAEKAQMVIEREGKNIL